MMESIRRNVSWRAIGIAWLCAGTVFLLINLILTQAILQVDAPLTLRYIASLAMGSDVLVDTTGSTLLVGVIVHYALSFLFTLLIAFILHRWGLLVGIFGGAILGLAIYSINVYTLTLLFPWFYAINSPILLMSHVLFGAVAGGVYEIFDTFDQPFLKGKSA